MEIIVGQRRQMTWWSSFSKAAESLLVRGASRHCAGCSSPTAKKKTTFGIPSPMPFMGRQKFFETSTYYSGEVFLEVFDKEIPLKPIAQFKRNFRNLYVAPVYDMPAAWVQGAETPLLIVVEKGIPEKRKNGKYFS
jgi:hypothetical protein